MDLDDTADQDLVSNARLATNMRDELRLKITAEAAQQGPTIDVVADHSAAKTTRVRPYLMITR